MNKLVEILPKYGYLTFSSLIIATLTGVLLGTIYNPVNAKLSIAALLLQNPAGALLRSLHYWSANLFLILAIIHVLDHLLKFQEITLNKSVWLRTVLSVPFILFVMLSGFFLRGDAESSQAILIFSLIIKSIPFLGDSINFLIFGNGNSLQIIYLHHIATATIFIWLSASEHSKVFFSDRKSYFWILSAVIILAIFLIPGIHYADNFNLKSPWYFIGLQELLHWLNFPLASILLIILLVSILYFYNNTFGIKHKFLAISLLAICIFYLILSFTGLFLRGDSWVLDFSFSNIKSQFSYLNIFDYSNIDDSLKSKNLLTVRGNPESCLACHSGMKGLSKYHNPDSIGCFACHLGNPLTLNKTAAHEGMTMTPGNLSIASKTCSSVNCHIGLFERLDKNIMNTMNGVIAVDKFAFSESKSLDAHFKVDDIGFSAADIHLRNLCVGCHTGKEKDKPDVINELTRGGGCSACHLQYSPDAEKVLNLWKKNRKLNINTHPDINLSVNNKSCFGCHSRSGRIATNYEGWAETELTAEDYDKMRDKSNYRLLLDGRVFQKNTADVHYLKALDCIDCHTSYELMGNGSDFKHKEEAVQIECIDCHRITSPKIQQFNRMDVESQKIINIRNLFGDGRQFVLLTKSGLPLINVYLDNNNNTIMRQKNKDTLYQLKEPIDKCSVAIDGHERLTCRTCHTRWAPQCISCHTSFKNNETGWDNIIDKETKGAWIEIGHSYLSEPPALGIIQVNEIGTLKEKVATFVPGMIMTFSKDNTNKKIFSRLYAPISAHTITKESRTCKSCHFSSLALGYGRGILEYKITNNKGEIIFNPFNPKSEFDKLPLDAWIGFLSFREKATTRMDARPFTVHEQKKILTVGVCLNCHNEKEKRMINIFRNFKDYKKQISRKCILPFN